MNGESPHTDARERVLAAAEQLFAQRGYAAVTLRDIAAEVGIRHASLYYHVPGGKAELFVEVTERNFARHRLGLTAAIAQAAPDIRSRLHAIAGWLISQEPMDLLRMTYADIPSLAPDHANRLANLAFESIFRPVIDVLEHAHGQGEVAHDNLILVAGAVISMIEGLHAAPPEAIRPSAEVMANQMIDIVLDGIRLR